MNALPPGLQGFVMQDQDAQRRQAGELQRAQGLMQIQGLLAKRQQEQAFRSEISQAKTPEEQMAVATKYMGPDALAKMTQTSWDRQAQIRATQENARARITQTLTLADMQHRDRMRTATTAEARAAEIARHNRVVESVQRDAVTNAGARLAYDIGVTPANSAPSAAPQPAPQTNGLEGILSGRPQDERSAISAIYQAGNSPMSVTLPPAGGLAPMLSPRPAQPPAAPAPAQIPTGSVTAPRPAIPAMPPEIASAPRRVQDQWRLQQTQAAAKIPATMNSAIQDVGNAFEKSNISKVEGALSLIEDSVKDVKDLPGYGATGPLPTFALSQAGKDLRTRMARLFNIELKDRSGAAVTIQELERLKEEFASGKLRTDEDLKRALTDYRKILNNHKTSLAAGFQPEAVAEYQRRVGGGKKTGVDTNNPLLK